MVYNTLVFVCSKEQVYTWIHLNFGQKTKVRIEFKISQQNLIRISAVNKETASYTVPLQIKRVRQTKFKLLFITCIDEKQNPRSFNINIILHIYGSVEFREELPLMLSRLVALVICLA